MIIELQRAFDPEEFGHEEECGICGLPFRTESVLTQAATDSRMDMGHACRACVEYLGNRNPERCPSIEEYRDALERYPEPIRGADEEGDLDDAAYRASWLWTAPAQL